MHFYVLISFKWVYFTANMSRKNIYIITFITTFCIVNTVQAQFRKYSNEFLNIGAGARGMAMGGAQIASVEDATAGYWNPAALANVQNEPSLALMHADYFAGIGKYEYAGMAIPTNNKDHTLGISFIRFAVDDIPNTLYLVNGDGSIDYNNISTFSSADYALLLSYARKVKIKNANLNIGGNAKIIYRNVGSFASAWGFGFDAGAQLVKGKWRFGAVLRDVTTTFNAWSFSFSDPDKQRLYLTKNDIPLTSTELTAPHLTIGAAYEFKLAKKVTLLAESNWALNFDGKRNNIISTNFFNVDPNIGLEANFNKVFFLRTGIGNFQQALSDADTTNQKKVWIFQPSIGAGFNFGNLSIDYAYSNLSNQSSPLYSHIFSLKLNFVKNGNSAPVRRKKQVPENTEKKTRRGRAF